MASSSRNINMPVVFTLSVASAIAMFPITYFGQAWFNYESHMVIDSRVDTSTMRAPEWHQTIDAQTASLQSGDMTIEQAMAQIVERHAH